MKTDTNNREQIDRRWPPRVTDLLVIALRFPKTVFDFFFARRPPSRSRRALLQGKLWRLGRAESDRSTMITRYPQAPPASPENAAAPAKAIQGISIEPVAMTDLSSRPVKRNLPLFRPPGAIDEARFVRGCTRCGDCHNACPHDAIRNAPARFGELAGLPVIDADTQACLMCSDFPCIAACDEGVLTDSIPVLMGTAKVTEQLCIAHHGTTCTVCSERCPVPGAIEVTDGKPTVQEELCTGCGVCRYVCPAPENAILLMPAFDRPTGL